jgi:hypothetical protein
VLQFSRESLSSICLQPISKKSHNQTHSDFSFKKAQISKKNHIKDLEPAENKSK